jgi:hypothetical protein
MPVFLSLLAFIGGLAVKALMQMSADINEIKTTIATESAKREAIEERLEKVEHKIFA